MFTAAWNRDEFLLDESIKETFPASDSTSPAIPGSLLGVRYAIRPHSLLHRWRRAAVRPEVIGALICVAVAGIVLTRSRLSFNARARSVHDLHWRPVNAQD